MKRRDFNYCTIQCFTVINKSLVTDIFLIQVDTEKDGVDHNTFVEFDVHAYNSPSKTFLYVRAIRVSCRLPFQYFYVQFWALVCRIIGCSPYCDLIGIIYEMVYVFFCLF